MKSQEGKESHLFAGAAPFAVPLLVFMAFLMVVDGQFPSQHYILYPLKSVLGAAILAFYWRALPSLWPKNVVVSVVIGVVAVVLWIALWPAAWWINGELMSIWQHGAADSKPEAGVSPFELYSVGLASALFVCRVLGSSLVVPIMEELFWRGFLMRWLIREDFTEVPLGTYQAFSFWVTTIFFASVHGIQWPMAMVVGVLYGVWFVKTKSLGNVMVAHGVTNFLLALYCLYTGDWHFLCTASLPK